MTIANNSDLLTAVANWAARSDLTNRIPEGIVLAEAKMNRWLRTRNMVSRMTFTINAEYVPVPSNFAGVKSFWMDSGNKNSIDFMPDRMLTDTYIAAGTGQPKHFNVQGPNFHFGPAPDATYAATLVYYLLVPALSSALPVNWMIASHPDAYLYGTMAEMSVFAKNWEEAKSYWDLMYQALTEVKRQSQYDTYGGDAALAMRPG